LKVQSMTIIVAVAVAARKQVVVMRHGDRLMTQR
jgi:hypothetical protein